LPSGQRLVCPLQILSRSASATFFREFVLLAMSAMSLHVPIALQDNHKAVKAKVFRNKQLLAAGNFDSR